MGKCWSIIPKGPGSEEIWGTNEEVTRNRNSSVIVKRTAEPSCYGSVVEC